MYILFGATHRKNETVTPTPFRHSPPYVTGKMRVFFSKRGGQTNNKKTAGKALEKDRKMTKHGTIDLAVPTKLHVVEFEEVDNGALDGMEYTLLQNVTTITVISWNVVMGLIYRALLFKYTWENGIFNRPINLLTG